MTAAVPKLVANCRCDQQGMLTAFVALMAVPLLLIAGLVLDAGRSLAGSARAQSVAYSAARAGSEAISTKFLYRSQVEVNCPLAVVLSEKYISSQGAKGYATCVGNAITVDVQLSEPTIILGLVGISTLTERSTAAVLVEHGVSEAE